MPNISLTVSGTEQSVLRPIIMDMVKQIQDVTKIATDTLILFPGDIEKTYQPGSTIDKPTEDRSRFLNNNMIHIEVDEDYNRDAVLSTAVTRPEHVPIFVDNKLRVVIRPVYSPTTVSINFKFRSKSKSTISRWRNDIRMRISMMRDVNLHQISYHYLIPDDIIRVLTEVHRLREAVAPYNESFATYLTTNSTTRLTELSNQSGIDTKLGIAETQMRIVGYFDFDGVPDKIEQDTESDTYIGSFTYKFNFDKPIACNMIYPVMIHNQILDTNFRPPEESYNLDNQIASYSESFGALSYFEITNKMDKLTGKSPGVILPPFDEFVPSSVVVDTSPIFSALCQISDEDKRTLINLKELDFILIDADILDFIMLSEYPFLRDPYKSILHVDLYKNNSISNRPGVNVDKDLNVIADEDLDFRINYRVRFSLVTNLDLLSEEALDRLRRFPIAMVKILQAIMESLRNNFDFTNLSKYSVISRNSLNSFIAKGISTRGKTNTFGDNLPFTIYNNGVKIAQPSDNDNNNNGYGSNYVNGNSKSYNNVNGNGVNGRWVYPNGVGGLDKVDGKEFLKWWPGMTGASIYGVINKTNSQIDGTIKRNNVQISGIIAIRKQT